MRFRGLALASALIFVSLQFVPRSAAQTATGTIIGHVTDSSGAILPGVEVTAVNPEKGFNAKTTTDEQGIYRLFYLAPASYTISFEHAGFSKLEREGIELRSNDTLTVDTQMKVGSLSEKVEVTTPLLCSRPPHLQRAPYSPAGR